MEENWRDYYHKGFAVFLTVAMCILFFFVVFRFDQIRIYAGIVTEILRPFAIGAVIAYLLTPLCNWFERWFMKAVKIRKMPHDKEEKYRKFFANASVFLSLFIFCMVIYALVAMAGAQVVESIQSLLKAMPGYIQRASEWIEKQVSNEVVQKYVEEYSETIMKNVQSFDIQNFAQTKLLPNINNIINGVSVSLWTLVSVAKDLVIGLIVAVYLMNSRKTFSRQAVMLVRAAFPVREDQDPEKEPIADWILRETRKLNSILGGFIKGKLLDSLIIGLICMFFTSLMDMPYAALVSVVIGVTNIIPFFGPFIGAIPTAFLILMVSPIKCVYFIIFILVLQQFDGNILGPKILGESTNLGSFWVLFAILLFGGLFGVPGMIMGVPVFAFIYHLVREWVLKRLKDQKLKKSI